MKLLAVCRHSTPEAAQCCWGCYSVLREATLRECEELATLTQPAEKCVPDASRRTWAGKNYCSGWNQAMNNLARKIHSLREVS